MILIFLAFGAAWLGLAAVIAGGIARTFAKGRWVAVISVPLYLVMLPLPVADEIIGRRQFGELCNREAKVWIAPNATEVAAARQVGPDLSERDGLVIPVQEHRIVYLDAHTGNPFYTVKSFHTPGGFILRNSFNMGTRECRPDKLDPHQNGIDIDMLMKRGKLVIGAQRSFYKASAK